ncbi:MAG: hypothetical protein CMH26_08640 [Micavibrio sp.]|nr:hypothetical protein [Micavibrio sp.]
MDKRKEKKLANKARDIERDEALHDDIRNAIASGASYLDLQARFSDAVITRSFSRFSLEDYQAIEECLGPAASSEKILIDECVNPKILPYIHQNLGIAKLSSLINCKNISDEQVFARAADLNFKAIISNDYISAGHRDLCGIAKRAYERDDRAPQIIIVSQDIDEALSALSEHLEEIKTLIKPSAKPQDVYLAR